MEKAVFVNDEIFQSDGDYVIGGFTTDKVDEFTLNDFKNHLEERISKLIDDYLERATLYNAELGLDNPQDEAKQDLALVLKDNLGLSLAYTDKQTIIKSVLSTEKIQKWVTDLRYNIMSYEQKTDSIYKGIYNQAVIMDKASEQYTLAKYFTEETTLESFVEQLSLLEL
jgi:hypothetical protein